MLTFHGCLCSASDMAWVVWTSSLKSKLFSYQLLCSVARERVSWRECQRSGNNFQTRKYFFACFHVQTQRTMKMKLRKVMDDACVASGVSRKVSRILFIISFIIVDDIKFDRTMHEFQLKICDWFKVNWISYSNSLICWLAFEQNSHCEGKNISQSHRYEP